MLHIRDRRSVCRSIWGTSGRRRPRVGAAATVACATTLAAMTLALPAGAATSRHSRRALGADAACPWVGSNQPIAERVAQVMSNMSVADEDFLVEGHGTTNEGPNPSPNPYVFWMPGLPNSLSTGAPLCIPALGEEDGP